MTDHALDRRDEHLPERAAFLIVLALPAIIWLAHFLVVYSAAAVWCARVAGEDGSLGLIRPLALGLTVLALGAISWTGWHGYRRHRHGSEATPHDMDTPGDRHRFLGFATLLLAALSAVATIFVGLAVLVVGTCQ